MTGKPISRAAWAAASGSSSAPVPGVTGTPCDSARARASSLEPIARIAAAGGPMKAMPTAAQASGNSGRSERKP